MSSTEQTFPPSIGLTTQKSMRPASALPVQARSGASSPSVPLLIPTSCLFRADAGTLPASGSYRAIDRVRNEVRKYPLSHCRDRPQVEIMVVDARSVVCQVKGAFRRRYCHLEPSRRGDAWLSGDCCIGQKRRVFWGSAFAFCRLGTKRGQLGDSAADITHSSECFKFNSPFGQP